MIINHWVWIVFSRPPHTAGLVPNLLILQVNMSKHGLQRQALQD